VIKDNITEFDQYRWANQCITGPDGTACINSSLNTGGTSTISNNAIINSGAINGGQGISDATITTRYGSLVLGTYYDTTVGTNYSGAPFLNFAAINTDYHNFALTGSGGWINAASDGTNPGVNFTTLDAALSGTCSLGPTGALPSGMLAVPYSQAMTATGCTSSTYTISTGTICSGLTLNASSGVISGTPTAAQTCSFTVAYSTASAPVSITIVALPSFTVSGPGSVGVGSVRH